MLFWLGVVAGAGMVVLVELGAAYLIWHWFMRPEPDSDELRAFRKRLANGRPTTPVLDLAERGAKAPPFQIVE